MRTLALIILPLVAAFLAGCSDDIVVRVVDQKVIDQKEEWLQVTTDPRRIGWLRRDQVLVAAGDS